MRREAQEFFGNGSSVKNRYAMPSPMHVLWLGSQVSKFVATYLNSDATAKLVKVGEFSMQPNIAQSGRGTEEFEDTGVENIMITLPKNQNGTTRVTGRKRTAKVLTSTSPGIPLKLESFHKPELRSHPGMAKFGHGCPASTASERRGLVGGTICQHESSSSGSDTLHTCGVSNLSGSARRRRPMDETHVSKSRKVSYCVIIS